MTPTGAPSRLLAVLALLALSACALALLSGLASALSYTSFEPSVRAAGLTLQHLRPVHESAAFAWVFWGGVAVVYFYLFRTSGPPSRAMRLRVIAQVVLWAAGGAGIVWMVLAGQWSGREYIGFAPVFSLLILLGWLLFAWNYFSRVGFSLRGQPAYIYMWSVAIPLFLISFGEGHLYLFEGVSERPVRDIALQWKSAGTMVGAFNQLAYGALMYVAGCIRGDDRYAHSRTAFALLFVGVLNTFTNYGHHTYHLPQSSWIHWTSFVVSMLEVVILAKVLLDLFALRKAPAPAADLRVPVRFARSAVLWTFFMLTLALAISVPPLNALIHGTHVVVAHSMGSMLGIDSMILWAAMAYILWTLVGPQHPAVAGARVRAAIPLLNVSLLVFLLSFGVRGAAAGWTRYVGPSAPDLSIVPKVFPAVMISAGGCLALAALWILAHWMAALLRVVKDGGGQHDSE